MRWALSVVMTMLLLGTAEAVDAQQPPAVAKAPAAGATVGPTSTVTSPHGTGLREPCASCHKANAWKPARISPSFRHAERTFPLSGAHARATCASCHTSPDFRNAPATCASCHSDPHKGEFGVGCARCHNTRSFIDRGTAVRTHQASRFPLRGAHAIATCEACHARTGPGQLQFASRGVTCQSCHQAAFRATRSPNHVAAHFSGDCTSCHTISSWSGAAFDHNATKFALTGRHKAATCQGCHSDNVYAGRSTSCASCHQADYARALEPKHGLGFPTTCESCHGTAQWKGARFDHNQQTRYPLVGKHAAAPCASCHKSGSYAGTPSTCLSCHQPDVDRTSKPPHRAAGFSGSCEGCHNTNTWLGAPFDHATTKFALTGSHRAVSCEGCHADQVFRGKPMACASCHQGKADVTTSPHHTQARFASTCESCHSTTAWAGARYDHALTRFPLTGGHVSQTCLACHSDRVYAGKPTACVGCHQATYSATTTPHHEQARFATTCESCHTTQRWPGVAYDHNRTRFPLIGRHVSATCLACHNDRVYAGKPSVCQSCHQREFDATTAPNHRATGIPATCEACHTSTTWKPATFDHTRFPLNGAHRTVACASCHADGVFRGTPSTCVSCHQSKFDATTRPNHRASGIASTCESCHTATAWTPAAFDHAITRFPLAGAHRAVNCAGCHADGVYRGKPTTCVGCHQAKFDATTMPNHRTSGIPTTCETCHSSVAWRPATFDHAATRFPLAGAHRTATCGACHGDGVYRGKPTTCVSCHQARFDATTRPNHRASGIASTCESCHTVTAWTPASFNHAATRFPLTGAHVSATCLACHSDGVYRGKPTLCASCHTSVYDATTNPNHRTAMFPTTCESCHTTTRWAGATFNHDGPWFPIYSGKHREKWSTCTQCHTNSGNYREFTCLSCHEHRQTAMDDKHRGRSGYRYESVACYSCHPRGDS